MTGSLATPRASATGTLLPNGKTLLSGGVNGGLAVGTVERYDAGAGAFVATGGLMQARGVQQAILLRANGKLLSAGGFALGTGTLISAELHQ